MDRHIASSSTFIACFLLCLFTFSSARAPFLNSISAKIGIEHINSFPLSEKNPDDASTILLPSMIPKPAKLIQWEPNSKTSKARADTIKSTEIPTATETSEASNPLPFTVFSLRPMDPCIPRLASTSSFRPIHRCHHNHPYRPWNQHLPRLQRKHGNDVIFNDVKDLDFDPVARGGMRRDPARWLRFGHIEPMSSRERSMALERRELLRKLYNRHYRRRNQEPEIKDTRLVKRIRKFLNPI